MVFYRPNPVAALAFTTRFSGSTTGPHKLAYPDITGQRLFKAFV